MKTLIASLIISAGICITAADPIVISGGPENDYESWIARLNDGRLMTVFDRNPDWASGDLYVTFSEDDGLSWSNPEVIIEAERDQATLSFVQMQSDTIRLFYASNESGIYKINSAWSLDGVIWTLEGSVNLGWSNITNYYDPTVMLEPDNSLTMSYVVMSNGVYVSHCPYGGQWDTLRTLVAASSYRPRIMKHTDGTYLYAYHTRTGGNYEYDVFVKSSTDLLNWSDPVCITDNRNSHDPFVCRMPDDAYMIYYAKYQGAAYNLCRRKSFDHENWEPEEVVTFDNTNSTQPHLFIEGSELYLVWAHAVDYPTDHDVYFERFDYATGIANEALLPQDVGLQLKNYPNPFNISTQISFILDREQAIQLDIYDLLGRKVDSLIETEIQSGRQAVVWSANGLGSGIYLARLKAIGGSETIKLLLLK